MGNSLTEILVRLTPKRRWAQFSLGSLFLVVTALCVWLGVVVHRAHRQREAVTAIEALGGKVEYAEPSAASALLRRWLPRDYREVAAVDLWHSKVRDTDLSQLHKLTGLRGLSLGETWITDDGLAALRGLNRLQGLVLVRTQVSDAGLSHLKALASLRSLWLNNCTQVTDSGVAQLQEALPDCAIIGP